MMGEMAVVDGWYAWLVCAASFLTLVIQGGLTYSMGVFYIMFQDALDANDSALSLVTSLNNSIRYLVGPFVGMLADKYNDRPLALFGALLATVGLVSSSFATEVHHLYLSYSLLTGIGFGLVYNPCMSIIGKYFKKYIKTAMGLVVCGSGVGSFVFPPIIGALEDTYGWRGAFLLLGGIYAHIIVFCYIYRPEPPQPVVLSVISSDVEQKEALFSDAEQKEVLSREADLSENIQPEDILPHGIANGYAETQPRNMMKNIISLFKNVQFSCLCLYSMLTMFPTILIYVHFGKFILTRGYTKGDVVYLYMAIGISTTICRPLMGFGVERIKVQPTILVIGSAVINGLLTMFLPFFHGLILMYVYGVIFAIGLSPYVTFCFPIVKDCVPKGQDATAYGIVCLFCVPATAFGAPLAARLYEVTNQYASSFYLAGILFILSGLIMIPAMFRCGQCTYSVNHQTQQVTKQDRA